MKKNLMHTNKSKEIDIWKKNLMNTIKSKEVDIWKKNLKHTTKSKEVDIWKKYTSERKRILDKVQNKDVIERRIIRSLKKKMALAQRNREFFSWSHLLSLPDVKKHFTFIAVTGDRNLGKTTDARKICKEIVDKKGTFVWMRNRDKEIEKLAPGEKQKFWNDYNWIWNKGEQNVYRYDEKLDKAMIAGSYIGLQTSDNYKSAELISPKVIVYDEFNSSIKVTNKFSKLIRFTTTAQRLNKDMKVLLMANFIDQSDDILQKLGIGVEQIKNVLMFNWVTGAILWFVPGGIYAKGMGIEDTIGYRASLTDIDLFKEQYGGQGYVSKFNTNIINFDKVDIKNVKLMFGLMSSINSIEAIVTYWYLAKSINGGDQFVYVHQSNIMQEETEVLSFGYKDSLTNIDSTLSDIDRLTGVYNLWRENKVKFSSSDVLRSMKIFFTTVFTKTINGDLFDVIQDIK